MRELPALLSVWRHPDGEASAETSGPYVVVPVWCWAGARAAAKVLEREEDKESGFAEIRCEMRHVCRDKGRAFLRQGLSDRRGDPGFSGRLSRCHPFGEW